MNEITIISRQPCSFHFPIFLFPKYLFSPGQMLPSSTVLSLAGAGIVLTVNFSGELVHLEAKCSPRPRMVFSRWCIKELSLQQHTINGFKSKKRNSLSSCAFGRKAEDSFFSVKYNLVPCNFRFFFF